MEEPNITPEDKARYMEVMANYDAAMREHYTGPVPMCHFTPMTQHWDDSHPACDSHWYECEHCGHTLDSAEAWAKVKAREAAMNRDSSAPAADAAPVSALF